MPTDVIREQLIDQVQLNVDPIITELSKGFPMPMTLPGQRLFRPVSVPNWNFQYRTYGNERLRQHDTERAMRAAIKKADFAVSTAAAKLKRFSFMAEADQDELANANPTLRLRELKAGFAKTIVSQDIERTIHAIVTDVTPGNTYATGHILNLTNGFNDATAGDSRAAVRAACALISAKTGMPYTAMTVFLPESSLQAAYDDPEFLAKRQYTGTATPNMNDLAAYWGVGRVWSANPVVASGTTLVTPLYADIAVVYLDSLPVDYDTEYGEYVWGATFKWQAFPQGMALAPFYKDENTTWHFPFQDYALPKVINANCAAIITNCVD